MTLTSTDYLLTSTDLYWISTDFYWLSTDFFWPPSDCQIQSGAFKHSLEQIRTTKAKCGGGGWTGLAGSWNWLTTRAPLGGANKLIAHISVF